MKLKKVTLLICILFSSFFIRPHKTKALREGIREECPQLCPQASCCQFQSDCCLDTLKIIEAIKEYCGSSCNSNCISITTDTTITEDGCYQLIDNTQACITIDADDVLIKLNGFTLFGSITILQGHNNIEIIDGKIKYSNCNDHGILVEHDTKNIQILDVHIFDFLSGAGIYFEGFPGLKIKDCQVKDCTICNCNKGIFGNYIKKCCFENCKVKNCFETGFELRNSNNNIFTKCHAIEIENDDPQKDAVGFYDYSGDTNVFNECIAQDVTKIENGYQAAGFLITGTYETQTSGDKIINCLSNSITFSGDGFSFGILLEKSLLGLIETATSTDPGFVFSVNWDPTGKYLATGGTGEEIRIFEFRPTEPTLASRLVEIAHQDHPATVRSVNWDPTGKYLALGGTGDNEIRVFEFRPTEPILADRLVEIANQDDPSSVSSVNWDPTGKYLATGGTGNNEIRVFEFRPTETILANRLVEIANQGNPATVSSLNWDPTGKYLATGGTGDNKIRVFEFRPTEPILANRLVEVARQDHPRTILSVNWDPTGKYLATGGEGDNEIRVFEFIPTEPILANRLVEVARQDHPDFIIRVNWDPTGKYLATGGAEDNEIRVFEFIPTEPVLANRLVEVAHEDHPETIGSVNWDPTGKYLATGGASGDEIRVFLAFSLPENCIILHNEVGNGSGIGIEGDGINSNLIAKNIGYNNPRNFTTGMFNIFSGGLNGIPGLMQNISVPPYTIINY